MIIYEDNTNKNNSDDNNIYFTINTLVKCKSNIKK